MDTTATRRHWTAEVLCFGIMIGGLVHPVSGQSEIQRADQLERRGISELQGKDIPAAVAYWREALDIYRRQGAFAHQARLLGNFGQLYLNTGDFQAAVAALVEAASIANRFQQTQAEADFLLKLGRAYRGLQDFAMAQTTYQRALQLAEEAGDAAGVGEAAGSLGRIAQNQGDLERALLYFTKARDAGQASGNDRLTLLALASVGDLRYEQGDFDNALKNHSQALQLARKLQDGPAQMDLLHSIGNAYYFLGNCEYAAAFYDWGWTLALESDEREKLGMFAQNRGNAEYCLGRFRQALESYNSSMEIARQSGNSEKVSRLAGNIGRVYSHLGQYEKAVQHLEEDLRQAGDSPRAISVAAGSLGDAYYLQGDHARALDYYRQSAGAARKANYVRGEALMLSNIGAAALRIGRWEEAEEALRQAEDLLATLRYSAGDRDENQISLFEREARNGRLLQQVLVARNQPEAALEAAEAGRAQVFSRTFGGSERKALRIAKIRSLAASHQLTIIFYSLVYDLDERKDHETTLYAWVVTPEGSISFSQTALAAQKIVFRNLIGEARRAIGIRERGVEVSETATGRGQQDTLRRLYDLLIGPLESDLPKDPNAPVVIVPQEELFLLSFAALQDEQGRYLAEKHPLFTAPGISSLAQVGPTPVRWSDALVVGNPVMPVVRRGPTGEPEQLSSLPGAEDEAEAIASFLKVKPLTRGRATKAAVLERMARAKLIHLATHGLLDVGPNGQLQANPLGYSGAGGAIALAPVPRDDGLLTAAEIGALDLDAGLVVLSACNTGRGRITGDGVLGLSRAFLKAGAEAIVVSLWQVPDQPTSFLMKEFYRQLKGGAGRGMALQQAMLKTKAQYPEPINWAAFTLIGNPF